MAPSKKGKGKREGAAKEEPVDAPSMPAATMFRGVTASVLALVIPGLGHAYLGKLGRAAAMLCGITAMAVLGLAHHGGLATPRPGEPLSYLATFANLGIGPAYFVLRATTGLAIGDPDDRTFEYGSTYMLSAGLLNFLAMLDAFDIAVGRKP
ncbi:MAG: DUF6677 family protein [Acidobacteriota bacterium]